MRQNFHFVCGRGAARLNANKRRVKLHKKKNLLVCFSAQLILCKYFVMKVYQSAGQVVRLRIYESFPTAQINRLFLRATPQMSTLKQTDCESITRLLLHMTSGGILHTQEKQENKYFLPVDVPIPHTVPIEVDKSSSWFVLTEKEYCLPKCVFDTGNVPRVPKAEQSPWTMLF